METYSFLAVPMGIIIGVFMVILTKRNPKLQLTNLDRIGIVTNVILIPVYLFLSAFTAVLALATIPEPEGLTLPYVVGELLLFIIACTPIASGFCLGLSVRFRRLGRSSKSFFIQFVGLIWFILANFIYEIASAVGLFVVSW